MKKIILVLLLSLMFSVNFTQVHADIGPKPSLKVTIIGMEDTPYTFELLSEDVQSNYVDPEDYINEYSHYLQDDYPDALLSFTCRDGLSAYSVYGYPNPGVMRTQNTVNTQEYQMNYYPPREFKVLIYLEDGTAIISDLVSRIYFDSHMTWDVSSIDTSASSEGFGVIEGNVHIGPYAEVTEWDKLDATAIPRMLIRILITLSIEIGILFLFKYRKRKSYGIVALTNAATQILLTYLVARTALFSGYFSAVLLLLFLEAFIFILEGVIYGNLLHEHGVKRALLYTFIANATTLIVGFYLVIYL